MAEESYGRRGTVCFARFFISDTMNAATLGYVESESSDMIFSASRKMLIDHSFFAIAWNAPQEVDSAHRENLRCGYIGELELLRRDLPERFRQMVEKCLDEIEKVMALPMVLLHRDFSDVNIMVDETECHLTGVIDWAEADIGPFGLNLYFVRGLMGRMHLKTGWSRFEDYEALQDTFWGILRAEVGELAGGTMETMRSAEVMGILLCHGFTSRLGNKSPPTPIGDDETGRYNLLYLDGLLVDRDTRVITLIDGKWEEGAGTLMGDDGRELEWKSLA